MNSSVLLLRNRETEHQTPCGLLPAEDTLIDILVDQTAVEGIMYPLSGEAVHFRQVLVKRNGCMRIGHGFQKADNLGRNRTRAGQKDIDILHPRMILMLGVLIHMLCLITLQDLRQFGRHTLLDNHRL